MEQSIQKVTPFRARIREIAEKCDVDVSIEAIKCDGDTIQAIESAILRAITELLEREPSEGMLRAANQSDRKYTDMNFYRGGSIIMQGPYDHWAAMAEQLLKEVRGE